jgi:hypothetical protein
MEGSRRYRDLSSLIQEARVGLYAREFLALEVEYLDRMGTSPTMEYMLACKVYMVDGKKFLHSKNREVLMCARRAKRMISGLDDPQRLIHTDIPQLDFAVPARA